MRTEKDFIGSLEIEDDALYGIQSRRAQLNFPDVTPLHMEWYKAMGTVKKACFLTCKSFYQLLAEKHQNAPVSIISDNILNALIDSATKIEKGEYRQYFIVPAISGGAGTSINMNINEILANASLLKIGKKLGEYAAIDPVEHANIYQSTNDVVPTSMKVAILFLLNDLEASINQLRQVVEQHERSNTGNLRIGYTQMQEAVPSSFGRLFSTYNEALSRDWWRISKCFERIKVVNLGGSAIGSGLTVPRYFIMEVVQTLQKLTGLPVARAENMNDATCNLDPIVEIHGILKAHAVNLEKMTSDLRLLASDVAKTKEIQLPQKQIGSTIMPAKVNPVIPEFVISSAHKVYSNDILITSLSAQGCLELNAYLPAIGHALIESLKLLIASNQTLLTNLFKDIKIDSKKAYEDLLRSPAITTALLPYIGYKKATTLSLEMKEKSLDIFQANDKLQLIETTRLRQILQPQNLLKEGFSVNDLLD